MKNRRATFDYHLEDRFEAGMVLLGSEVKSMRAGTVDITDAWASLERDGIYLKNLTVQPLPHTAYPHEPRRPRKLLLHAKEIEEIRKGVDHDKKTLIPLRIYLKKGLIKTEIALAIGKKKGDKRAGDQDARGLARSHVGHAPRAQGVPVTVARDMEPRRDGHDRG